MKDTVCELNIYYFIRLVFGYFHDFAYKPVRWIFKSIIFLEVLGLATITVYKSRKTTSFTAVVFLTLEHISYQLISLKYGNRYLQQYYFKLHLVDDPSNARYKHLEIFLILVGFLMIFSKFSYCYLLLTETPLLRFIDYIIISTLEWLALDFGRLPLLLVFSLLYVRVRFLRETLEKHPFSRSHGKHHPRTYIQMYEIIMDSLDRIEVPVKVQMFVYCFISVPYSLFGIIKLLDQLKRGVISRLSIILFVMEVTIGYMPLFLSAGLSDLVHEELQDIMAIVVKRRITSKNERDRAEIENLIQYLQSHPFEYNLCRVVPLNVHSLLTFLSFCITTIIAIMQINNVLLL